MSRSLISGLVLALSTWAGSAAALPTTYTYTGNPFNNRFVDGDPPAGSYSTADSVSGSFTLADGLAANLSNVDISLSVVSFEFTDGRSVLNDSIALYRSNFRVTTDSDGDITEWTIELESRPEGFNAIGEMFFNVRTGVGADAGTIAVCDDVYLPNRCRSVDQYDFADTYLTPGTWTVTVIPEPSAALLTGIGLAGLASVRRRVD